MPPTKKLSFVARLAFVLGGIATLTLVGFLLWAGFTAPLDSRMPVPSPDGKYFAYFNPGELRDESWSGDSELIISRPQGQLLARLRMRAGKIIWSNANHLVVVEEEPNQATLIANAEERFVVLTRIPLGPGGEPCWAPDGNKLACVRRVDTGLQLAVHDMQQPEAFPVPLPAGHRLNQPRLIFWTPGPAHLHFLDVEGEETVLQSVEVRTGGVRILARGVSSSPEDLPQTSPDGSRIFLPPPQNRVIDGETGGTLWALPANAQALWRPWSGDSREVYYVRQEYPSEIRAHHLDSSADQVVVSGVRPNGFFTPDGRTYFFREPTPPPPAAGLSFREWRKGSWGWRQSDRSTPAAQELGRLELWPWGLTLEGLVLARQDEYTSVRFGLYDADMRALEPYAFPTDSEDLHTQIRSYRLVVATVALFTFLAVLVLAKRPESRAARVFYIVSFLASALVCGHLIGDSVLPAVSRSPYRMTREEIASLGWWMSSALPQLVFDRVRLILASLWALLPLAALHFAFAFPERSRFLEGKKRLKLALYGVALLPAIATALGRFVPVLTPRALKYLLLTAGTVVAVVWVLSLSANYRFPSDKRCREQTRWAVAALGLLGLGTLMVFLLRYGETKIAGNNLRNLLHGLHSALLGLVGWVAPSAIAYGVAARKPSSLRWLLPRLLRRFLMGVPALVVFLIAWAGTGLVVSGALWAFSPLAILVAVLLAVVAVLPFRGRLRVLIDRTFDRRRFETREKLAIFARNLPHTVDREALAVQLEEALSKGMGTRRNLLFVVDRKSRKLRLQPGKTGLPSEVRMVEFDLEEPLCEFLMRRDQAFEPAVALADEDLARVMATAGERLRALHAEAVLGLRRNELVGLLLVGPKASGELYDGEELDSLRAIAREAATAIENIELFEAAARDREMRKELEDAWEIQAKLLPTRVPRLTTAQLAGCCFPARSTGGDHYDFIELPGRKVGLAMCDVAGRGMSAALRMASVASLLRAEASTVPSLVELVGRINEQLRAASPGPGSCTLFYAVYDEASHQLEYVNAGHVPPFLVGTEGPRFLDSTGPPLGLLPEITHQVRSVTLPPGALLLIYSDGVVETRNARGDSFGQDRLASALLRERDAEAEIALARVVTEVRDFEGETLLEDDQTLVLLKVYPE